MRKPFSGEFKLNQKYNDKCCRVAYAKFGLLGHNGLDYGCPLGTPILSPHNGTIKEATFDAGGYGNYIKVESANEGSILAHLSQISVSVGQEVQEGQLLGLSGNTGNSTGPHLHWGYYRTATRDRENGFLGYINPLDWLGIVTEKFEFTDQTKVPLKEFGEMELQAVVSVIRDTSKAITDASGDIVVLEEEKQKLQKQLDTCKNSSLPQFLNPLANLFYQIAQAIQGKS